MTVSPVVVSISVPRKLVVLFQGAWILTAVLVLYVRTTDATDNKRQLQYHVFSVVQLYNLHRTHRSLAGDTPAEVAGVVTKFPIMLNKFRWQSHCRGIYQLPIAA